MCEVSTLRFLSSHVSVIQWLLGNKFIQYDNLIWIDWNTFWTLISNVQTSKLIFCLYHWIQMDLGSLIFKGPQCLCKTFELRQGQPKIVISGPLYSYALEFFDARWTISLWYLYQVHCGEMNSVLCNGMDPWLCIALLGPSMWGGLSPSQQEGPRSINVGWTSGPLQCDELGPLTVQGLQVLWSEMDSALPSRKDLGPS